MTNHCPLSPRLAQGISSHPDHPFCIQAPSPHHSRKPFSLGQVLALFPLSPSLHFTPVLYTNLQLHGLCPLLLHVQKYVYMCICKTRWSFAPSTKCVYVHIYGKWLELLKLASSTMYARAYLISLALFGSPRELLASPTESSFVSSEKSA